jgi:enterobacterial common antigen polymerase
MTAINIVLYLGLLFLIGRVILNDFRVARFNFHLFFSLLFLITFFLGFPLSLWLVIQFSAPIVDPFFQQQALLLAAIFYGVYYLSYKTRLASRPAIAMPAFWRITRVEAMLFAAILALLAIITLAVFYGKNGLLLFRLTSYSQIFSSQVSATALKRFFYFFIPAMLVWLFSYPTRRNWWLFLLVTMGFGMITYFVVGGTRAIMLISLALFLFIGFARRWLSLATVMFGGAVAIICMFWLALGRYNLILSGAERLHTFLYLTRDTFSPWENLALLLSHYSEIEFQGIAPLWRDFYVYIPTWLWPDRPVAILNSANYFTWQVLNNHSGLAISPTLLGSLFVMGGGWAIVPGAVIVGLIIKIFDWLYYESLQRSASFASAILQSYCFGAIFNLIVLVREGMDAFGSRIVFFSCFFISALVLAKLLFLLLNRAGLIRLKLGDNHIDKT